MGNSQQKEGFDPKFVDQHRQKMTQIQGNYQQHNYSAPGYDFSGGAKTRQMHYQTIQRKSAILKPSISIKFNQNVSQAQISLKYQSQVECKIEINLGVSKVQQDQKGRTVKIQSHYQSTHSVQLGKKVQFTKNIDLNGISFKQFSSLAIVLRIHNPLQTTEYTLSYLINMKGWKVMIQKYENQKQICYLQDVFSGGQGGQQCIICMSDKANTMAKPCKHLCLCKDCAESMRNKIDTCPICRKKMSQLVTIALD